jgi:penicillin-binding protein 1A
LLQSYNAMSLKSNPNARYLSILWGLFILPILIVIVLFILISQRKLGYLPTFEDLENPQNNLASEVYTEDNELLGKYFIENRTFVESRDLSPNLINALVATEDIRFNKHSGIDVRGLGRVFFRTILGGQHAGGGSTITQQLAKNLFDTREIKGKNKVSRTLNLILIKFKEWHTAVRLERYYTKNEILVMYLNTVSFGHEAFGIKSAARIFFDTTPDSLKVEQAAILVGALRAPTFYSPVVNPENALKRRNVVIRQMAKYDFLTQEVCDSILGLPIVLNYRVQSHSVGYATHFRTYLRTIMMADKPDKANYFSFERYQEDSVKWETEPLYGWCNKNFKPDGSPYNLYRDGIRIYSAINYKMQKYAEEAVEMHLGGTLQNEFFINQKGNPKAPFSDDLTFQDIDRIMIQSVRRTDTYRNLRALGLGQDSIMKIFKTPRRMRVFTWRGDRDTIMSPLDSVRYYKFFLQSGFMAMEPVTGLVKAYVGGQNYKYFQYDHVTQGKRQVGSTFKPFLYTLAMQEGDKPCDMVPNTQVIFVDHDSTWAPRNSGNFDMQGKMVTLKWGLAHSVNYISARLVKKYNPQAVIDIVRKMGVTSKIDAVPSVIYGTSDISLVEMVGAFNAFSNKGVYVQPIFVTHIEDKNGNLLATFHPQQVEAISEKTAYLMVQLLRGVVDRGTGARLRWFFNFSAQMGGKTGTTQNQSDGWYMGITPRLTAGIWVGAEDRSVHFDNLGQGSGGYMALPVYGYFFQKVYADSSLNVTQEDVFAAPPDFNVNLDCPDFDGDTNFAKQVITYDVDAEEF